MLKIKNNVDLKELEKFGFKNSVRNTYYKREPNDDCERFETNIVINPVGNFGKNEIILEIADLDNSEEKSDIDIGIRLNTIIFKAKYKNTEEKSDKNENTKDYSE